MKLGPEYIWKLSEGQYALAREWDTRADRIAYAAKAQFGPGFDFWPEVYQRLWWYSIAEARKFKARGKSLEDQAWSLDF